MCFSLLPFLAAIALALSAPVASARLVDPPASPVQNLSSPDAQDANAAKNAQTLQDLVRLHSAPRFTGPTAKYKAALAQQQYYASFGTDPGAPGRAAGGRQLAAGRDRHRFRADRPRRRSVAVASDASAHRSRRR